MIHVPTPGKRPRLTRDRIIQGAHQLLLDEGIEAVSFRRIATNLDATPMALYRHVENRDDLLVEVLDLLLGVSREPTTTDPLTWLKEHARGLRSLLIEHPWAIEVYMRTPVVTLNALRRMECGLDVLVKSGFDVNDAAELYGLTTTFVIGTTALEFSRTVRQGGSDHWRDFFGQLAPESFPRLVQLSPVARNFVDERGFERGLRGLLAGVVDVQADPSEEGRS